MPKTWQKVSRVFAMHWSEALQYRSDMIAWTLVSTLTPLISLAIWYTVSTQSTTGPTPQTVFAYYIMIIITTQLTSAWHGFFMSNDILDGKIVKHLIRPFPYFWQPIANNIVEKAVRFPPIFIAMVILILLYPTPVFTDITATQITYYILSLILAATMSFFFSTTLGLLAFWLENAHEIMRLRFLFESVASGMMIPYAFMPDTVANILSLLPFRYIFAIPAEIIVGQVQGSAITSALAIQAMWTLVFIGLVTLMWKRGLKRYAIPGQ